MTPQRAGAGTGNVQQDRIERLAVPPGGTGRISGGNTVKGVSEAAGIALQVGKPGLIAIERGDA